MERFLRRHSQQIAGSISGFDRMLFCGTLRWMCDATGMGKFLGSHGVLLKDFGKFVENASEQVKQRAESLAQANRRPLKYLGHSRQSKEDIARQIAEQDGIQEGLVCVMSCVEPCRTFAVIGDRRVKQIKLVSRQRKCLHFYFYYLDPDFGLMHIRLQSWFPFAIHVCVNGREWLARQMDRQGMAYEKRDNSFAAIGDMERAQQTLDQLGQRPWTQWLHGWACRVNPFLRKGHGFQLRPYYWSLNQSEYATDVMFTERSALQQIYPTLIRHAMEQFHSQDVLRFLGQRTTVRFSGESTTHLGCRVEGVRIKHWVDANSIKMYDKGSVLRIETTINNPRPFKVRRRITRNGRQVTAYMRMRKGIVDIGRRVQLSRAANYRYLEALSVVGHCQPSHRVLDSVSEPVCCNDKRFRALRPITANETRVFKILLRGEFQLQGFRHKDLRRHLPAAGLDPLSASRLSGRITRTLQLFRAHDLIYRMPKTNYYRITTKGHIVMATSLRFRHTDVALLAA